MKNGVQSDSSLRFLFEEADIRGETVHLRESYSNILGIHPYSEPVQQLLGLFASAAVLISNNLKYKGKITLQARSEAAISLIMLECTSDSEIRGIARGNITAETSDPMTLISGGQLAITIEREGGQRYQGIVSLEGDSLARALDNYFLQSEQLHTRFWLAADGNTACGLMLQQLPPQRCQSPETREEQWQNATILADTVTSTELLSTPSETLIFRLFHESVIRGYEPTPVVFKCSCSRERSLQALACLPQNELDDILAEQGALKMNCEMCGTPYSFSRQDLSGLAEPPILH